MGDEVKITSPVVGYKEHCINRFLDLAYFSTKGVVRLKISNVPFVQISYTIVTTAIGIYS